MSFQGKSLKSLSELIEEEIGLDKHYGLIMFGGMVEIQQPSKQDGVWVAKAENNPCLKCGFVWNTNNSFTFRDEDIVSLIERERMGNYSIIIVLKSFGEIPEAFSVVF